MKTNDSDDSPLSAVEVDEISNLIKESVEKTEKKAKRDSTVLDSIISEFYDSYIFLAYSEDGSENIVVSATNPRDYRALKGLVAEVAEELNMGDYDIEEDDDSEFDDDDDDDDEEDDE